MLKVDVEKLSSAAVLYLQGHIVVDEETATLREAVFSHRDAKVVILDLSGVDVIDAAGLGALLELREWTQMNGTKFRLENPTRRVQQLFAITCLESVFDISLRDEVLPSTVPGEAPSIVAKPLNRAPLPRPHDQIAKRPGLLRSDSEASRKISKRGLSG
jgi:anti-anti-sigma factor